MSHPAKRSTDHMLISSKKMLKNNYQPNWVTDSIQLFSALEKNIVISIINQLTALHFDKSYTYSPDKNITFIIPYSLLSVSRNYQKVDKAAKSLRTREQGFTYYDKDGTQLWKYITPFPSVEKFKDEYGQLCLKIKMLDEAVPYYTELGKSFTSYDYEIMRSLDSVYSKRIYEILMKHYNTDTLIYDVSLLRTIINTPDSYDYYDFTRTCLDVAKREIREEAGIEFMYEPFEKIGKKVVTLKITKTNPAKELKAQLDSTYDYINKMPVGEAIALAHTLFHNYTLNEAQIIAITSHKDTLNNFLRIHSEIASGYRQAKNPTAYMVKSLGIEKIKVKKVKTQETALKRSTAAPSSIGSIMGGIDIFKKKK